MPIAKPKYCVQVIGPVYKLSTYLVSAHGLAIHLTRQPMEAKLFDSIEQAKSEIRERQKDEQTRPPKARIMFYIIPVTAH